MHRKFASSQTGPPPQMHEAEAGVPPRPHLAGPNGILALQRYAGNAEVTRLIAQRDPFEEIDLTGQPNKYMLSPPPARKQGSLTCWAASLSALLSAAGVEEIATDDIIGRYIGTSCTNTDNSLPLNTAAEVYLEWGVTFEFFVPGDGKPTGAQWRDRLRKHGHLLLADTHFTTGHVIVVYGSGFDADGKPDPEFISVMDPLIGGHHNIRADSLHDSFAIGHLGAARKRPAACMSKPAVVPPE